MSREDVWSIMLSDDGAFTDQIKSKGNLDHVVIV